ncbi:MAG: BlaI/MecI/CopY family transcriptional regulator [Bacteroidales bacterium]|nr:BlaI/MecI/CopY family transcriptional regulator [Bacteroidales bacterium]
MVEYKLGDIEMRFANLIWTNEPISSGELVKLAEASISWKKSTTYTILRKLCEKGIFQNENGSVTSLVSKEEYISIQSERFVDETFSGSLPQFIASFSMRKKLSNKELAEIQRLIDTHKGV